MGQNSIGERFGDYKVVRPLGEGGFASVYLGEEDHNKALAAVKLLKEQKVHDFINEVSRTNRLHHPNIVKILDFGIRTPNDTAFIIMEYAPNGSFREKYPSGTRVPLDIVVTSVKQVASALQYAHDHILSKLVAGAKIGAIVGFYVGLILVLKLSITTAIIAFFATIAYGAIVYIIIGVTVVVIRKN